MPLIETVTIGVGSAIAKSILKLWLKNVPFGGDASSSLIDILKTKTSDVLAQRRGQRQFEAIGEKVGESLLPLFERESGNISENSLTAIALAVTDVFSSISSQLLAKHNLDPTELAKSMLDIFPPEKQHFDSIETEFYQRIVEESCACIVDIGSQLPAFTEHTLAEILKREDRLLTIAINVLKELKVMRNQLDGMIQQLDEPERAAARVAAQFELEYRRALARNLDELQLLGVDVSNASRRHRLSIAYVTLSVGKRVRRASKIDPSEAFQLNPKASSQKKIVTRQEIVPVDEALLQSRRLIIRGLAGSGKTTLLKWIAVRSATNSFVGRLSSWNVTLPFYIRLRRFAMLELPLPESFPSLAAPMIADIMPKGWVHMQRESKDAIFLIDGLDEVPAAQLEKVYTWLNELVNTFPYARFIITTRPHAVEEDWMVEQNFIHAELQPMGMTDIRAFIDHWHQAVREELQEETEKNDLLFLAEHLKEFVKGSLALRSLATNPLLCAMLCALHRDRRQQLPADRIELYEACCYLLLERRDKERHIELSDYPNLTYRQKRALLEDLAYWLIKNGWTEVERQEADDRFARKLTNIQNLTGKISGTEVRRFFIERSSIIREPVVGRVDFTHRTFQEYLAAQAAIDEGDLGFLVRFAHLDQWREVIILASGLARRKSGVLVQAIIKRGDTEAEYQHRLHLLAVSCLQTTIELEQNVKEDVEKRISTLVPPKNLSDVNALASAGDLAVPYLVRHKGYPDSIAKLCIRTLARIGTELALEAIEEYTYNASDAIRDELLSMWDYFDRGDYACQVLSHILQGMWKVQLERLPSLEGFQHFAGLTSLEIANYHQISDLLPLSALTRLTSLDLRSCKQVVDLRPLSTLTQLTSLNLAHCYEISDLRPLATLTQLTSLNLAYCRQVTDLTSLSSLTQLKELFITDCRGITSLAPLIELNNLTLLVLGNLRISLPHNFKGKVRVISAE